MLAYTETNRTFAEIAAAIRRKTGGTETLTPPQMPEAIDGIVSPIDAMVSSVGDIPTVKAVDEDGFPTAWEAVSPSDTPLFGSKAPFTVGGAAALQQRIPTDNRQLANGAGYVTAQTAPVRSINGMTGAVTLTKAQIGLGNVDNTSDMNKPVSTAVQAALNQKAARGDIPQASSQEPAMDGSASPGSNAAYARGDHVHPTDSSRAPLVSPAFTGVPTAPTAAAGTNTTQIATTAFVQTAVQNAGGVKKFVFPFTAASWSGSGGSYALSVTATVHGCGMAPAVQVQRSSGSGWVVSEGYPSSGWSAALAENGDVTLRAAAAFAGRIILFG